jgi:uncharacterized protein
MIFCLQQSAFIWSLRSPNRFLIGVSASLFLMCRSHMNPSVLGESMDDFVLFLIVGFLAGITDGSLGMGFGVISSAILLGQNVSPALVSATVNAAKLPTGFFAAISHSYHRNVDWGIVRKVALYGALAGVLGAFVLTGLSGRPELRWIINTYLVAIGLLILIRAVRGTKPILFRKPRLATIGAIGGVIEGIGGSWGPVVTSALLGSGVPPRYAVGSSNTAEFIVSAAVLTKLLITYALGFWGEAGDWASVLYPMLGLVVGGIPAAFMGGWLVKVVSPRPLMLGVGFLVLGIAVYRIAF